MSEFAADFKVVKAEKETLSDGSEVLALELRTTDKDGVEQTVHDVIQTQERLDQFLISLGYPAGSMKLTKKNPTK